MPARLLLLDCDGLQFDGDDDRDNAILMAAVISECLTLPLSDKLTSMTESDALRNFSEEEMTRLEGWTMRKAQPAINSRLSNVVLTNVEIWGTTMRLEFDSTRKG